MTDQHTLSHGEPAHSKYAVLGTPVSKARVPFEHLRGLVVGKGGSGKSFLMQSCPTALILNFDGSACVNQRSQALMWPTPGPDGRTYDADGKPIFLSWEHVLQKKKVLEDLAKEGRPRPTTIALDTLPAMLSLMKDFVARRYEKASFEDLGITGAAQVNKMVSDLIKDLHNHGYGVFLVTHLINRKVPLNESQFVDEFSLNMSDGMFKGTWGAFDVSIPIVSRVVKKEVTEQVPTPGRPGSFITRTRTESVREFVATMADSRLDGVTKMRTLHPLSEVVLPSENAWAALSAAYEAANQA